MLGHEWGTSMAFFIRSNMKICLCGMVVGDATILCHNCGGGNFEPLKINICTEEKVLCSGCEEETKYDKF